MDIRFILALSLFLNCVYSVIAFEAGRCSIDDIKCAEAVAFARRRNEECDKNLESAIVNNTPINAMCMQDALQLKRRFSVVFNSDEEWEATCNPCAKQFCSREKKAPGTLPPCLPPDDLEEPSPIKDENKFEIERFLPKFRWHQDKYVQNTTRYCCITTKRTIPFTGRCGSNCYLVFCPFAGGYQWVDEVMCDVTEETITKGTYGPEVTQPSRGKCKKRCRTEFTDRAYLVTNLPPEGYFGHCSYIWLPVWFKTMKVKTHCVCPRI